MTHIIRVYKKPHLTVRLAKVTETESKETWVFTFVEPHFKWMQTIIMPKTAGSAGMEEAYERLWGIWTEKMREIEWARN